MADHGTGVAKALNDELLVAAFGALAERFAPNSAHHLTVFISIRFDSKLILIDVAGAWRVLDMCAWGVCLFVPQPTARLRPSITRALHPSHPPDRWHCR